MKKLELKHLAPYLPYGVEVKTLDAIGEIVSIIGTDPFLEVKDYTALDDVLIRVASNNFSDFSTWGISQIKPILRPLSNLRELIPNKGVCYISYLWYEVISVDGESFDKDDFFERCELGDISFLPHMVIPKLLEWHFDVFGLIEQDLAIDINTIKDKC